LLASFRLVEIHILSIAIHVLNTVATTQWSTFLYGNGALLAKAKGGIAERFHLPKIAEVVR
jgi:hypothetical protein